MVLVFLMFLVQEQDMLPVQYSMILPGIVMDQTAEEVDNWFGLFEVDCGHYMLRPVELTLVPEEGIVFEGERPLGQLIELPQETGR